MTSPDRRADLLEALYAATLSPASWPGVLRALAHLCNARDAMYGWVDKTGRYVRAFISDGSDDAILAQLLLADHAWRNPWVEASLSRPPGRALRTDDLVPLSQVSGTAFYHHVVEPLQLHHGLGCNLSMDADTLAVCTAFRPRGRGPFADDELQRYQAVMPHLQRAARIARQVALVDGEREAALAALQKLAIGVVLVGPGLRVRFANAEAEQILARADGLLVRRGQLWLAHPDQQRRLQRLAGQCAGAMTVARNESPQPLELLVAPLGSQTIWLSVDPLGPPTAAVYVTDPDQPHSGLREVVSELYGLTPTEARVALVMVRGVGVPEAARELGIAGTTVRSHLYSVMQKVGVKRQAELVRVLLGSVGALYRAERDDRAPPGTLEQPAWLTDYR